MSRTDVGDVENLWRWLTTVVARVCLDSGTPSPKRHGRRRTSGGVLEVGPVRSDQIVLVNGNIGLLERRPDGRLFAVIGFAVANGRIAEMNILVDPDRLSRLDLLFTGLYVFVLPYATKWRRG